MSNIVYDIELMRDGVRLEELISHTGLKLDWWWDLTKISYRAKMALGGHLWGKAYPNNELPIAGIETGGFTLAEYFYEPEEGGLLEVRKDGTLRIDSPIREFKVVLVDDVVTTGTSILAAKVALLEYKITVEKVICVLDRREELTECRVCGGKGTYQTSSVMTGLKTWKCPECVVNANNTIEITSLFTSRQLVEAGLIPAWEGMKSGI